MVKAVLVLALTGCSFGMGAPHGTPPVCSESRRAPLLDLAISIAVPVVAYEWYSHHPVGGAYPDAGTRSNGDGFAGVLFTSPVWALFFVSSIYGEIKADSCSRAKHEYQQRMEPPPALAAQ